MLVTSVTFVPSVCIAQEQCLFDYLQPASRPSLGLGGDPFLSPTRDEVGWWSELRSSDARIFRVAGASGEPVPGSKTNEHGTVGNQTIAADFTSRHRLLGLETAFGARIQNPSWATAWRSPDGEVRAEGRQARLRFITRVQSLPYGLALQASLPVWDDPEWVDVASARGGVRWNPREWLCIQSDYGSVGLPGDVQSSLYDAEWSAGLNCNARVWRSAGRVRTPWAIELEYSRTDSRYAHDDDVSRALAYQFFPDGTSVKDELSVSWRPNRATRLLARGTQMRLDLGGEAYWGGERFGLLNYARGDLSSLLVAAEYSLSGGSRFFVDVERVWGETDGRARFETWPFTETTIDLLGVRRIFRWEFAGELTRAHAATEVRFTRSTLGSLGLAWHHVQPSGWSQNWSPAFLVFGQTDLDEWRLEVDSANLITLALGTEWSTRGLQLGVKAQQAVYANLQESAEDTAPEPGGGDNGGEPVAALEPLGIGSWPTGGQVMVSIGRRF